MRDARPAHRSAASARVTAAAPNRAASSVRDRPGGRHPRRPREDGDRHLFIAVRAVNALCERCPPRLSGTGDEIDRPTATGCPPAQYRIRRARAPDSARPAPGHTHQPSRRRVPRRGAGRQARDPATAPASRSASARPYHRPASAKAHRCSAALPGNRDRHRLGVRHFRMPRQRQHGRIIAAAREDSYRARSCKRRRSLPAKASAQATLRARCMPESQSWSRRVQHVRVERNWTAASTCSRVDPSSRPNRPDQPLPPAAAVRAPGRGRAGAARRSAP